MAESDIPALIELLRRDDRQPAIAARSLLAKMGPGALTALREARRVEETSGMRGVLDEAIMYAEMEEEHRRR
jgi:hypothetical protein